MSYKVINEFADLQDSNHVYHVGDKYPREGSKPNGERIKELAGDSNKIGKPLIVEVKESTKAKKSSEKEAI